LSSVDFQNEVCFYISHNMRTNFFYWNTCEKYIIDF
jgi:hypothetical protein